MSPTSKRKLPSTTEQTQDITLMEIQIETTEDTQVETTVEQKHEITGQKESTPTSYRLMMELRKYILLLASVVATVTYAAGFSPPGDVWKDTAAGHLAGDPIIRDTNHKRYVAFFYCNATAFAASLAVIVITLTLTYLDDHMDMYSGSKIVVKYNKMRQQIAVRTLQVAMVVDLLSLMGAYGAGTCRDTFTTVYSSVLLGSVFYYVVVQLTMAYVRTLASLSNKADQDKAKERFRKVLMLLATFAMSITYLVGLSTPGGFWDSAGAGHRPGDAILKDRENTRLAVFFCCNTLAFVASLLIIVEVLDSRKLRKKKAYGLWSDLSG